MDCFPVRMTLFDSVMVLDYNSQFCFYKRMVVAGLEKPLKIAVGVLVLVCLATIGILLFQISQNSLWTNESKQLASEVGGLRAMRDFQAGNFRLFVISGENLKDKYSGTNESPYEIWISAYLPTASYQERVSVEWEVRSYNAVMKLHVGAKTWRERQSVAITNTLSITNLPP